MDDIVPPTPEGGAMDSSLQELLKDFEQGFLTRRGFIAKAGALGLTAAAAIGLIGGAVTGVAEAQAPAVQPKRWQRGKGWGAVWGPGDTRGVLNELSPELAKKALSLAKQGKVYDLGLSYDRRSYKWPGHSPGEILTFRSQHGEYAQRDLDFVVDPKVNGLKTSFASCALFVSDNVATQLDSLGHISIGAGNDAVYYNGHKAGDVVGNWGLMKMSAEGIPPIVAPATMIDVAGFVGKDPLPSSFAIGPDILRQALAKQGVDVEPLDVVLIRTGTAAIWLKGDGVGANQEDVAKADSAGITVAAAKWLVEEKAALMIGSDTSGLEVSPAADQLPEGTSFVPVHHYLIPTQGMHILEYHNQEDLAKDKVYKFCYVVGINKFRGATAGTALRPIAIA
jgi:kynurenine formamidase